MGVSIESTGYYFRRSERQLSIPQLQGNINKSKALPFMSLSYYREKLYQNYVESTVTHEEQEVLRLVTDSYKEIKVSPNQKLLTINDRWVEAKDLTRGTVICTKGELTCLHCGKEGHIIGQSKGANKLHNVCKTCVYEVFRGNPNKMDLYAKDLRKLLVTSDSVFGLSVFSVKEEQIVLVEKQFPETTYSVIMKKPATSFVTNDFILFSY